MYSLTLFKNSLKNSLKSTEETASSATRGQKSAAEHFAKKLGSNWRFDEIYHQKLQLFDD